MAINPRSKRLLTTAQVQPVAKSRPIGSEIPNSSKLDIFKTEGKKGDRVPDMHELALKAFIGAQQVLDPFRAVYGGTLGGGVMILQPEYSIYSLIRMPYENSILGQCIEAMVTNIYGMGYGFDYIGPKNKDTSKDALAERESIDNFCQYPNDEYTLQELKTRLGWDYESTGNSFIECGRDGTGDISTIYHLPAHTMRITTRHPESVPVTISLPRKGGKKDMRIKKTFRRYVQIVGAKKIWFKEFGDPRRIDPETGEENMNLSLEQSATEVIHFAQYNPGSPYGRPRWFNQLPAIMGSRQAELTNLDFFTENAIPAMALLVSGGQVTQNSINDIENHFQAARGRASMHRILVIEAQGDDTAAAQNGAVPVPKIELRPLQSERQGDAMFQNYEKNNRDKIRSSFRLTPLFVGLAEEMTYASAKTAYEVAETQVFMPERARFDDIFNMKVLEGLNLKFWKYKSAPPKLSDGAEISQAVVAFDEAGGLTPNIAILLANRYFDAEVPKITEAWGDYPMPLVMSAFQANKLTLKGLENMDPGEAAASAAVAMNEALPSGVSTGVKPTTGTGPTPAKPVTGAGPKVTPGKKPNPKAQAAGQTKPGKAAKPAAKQPVKGAPKKNSKKNEDGEYVDAWGRVYEDQPK